MSNTQTTEASEKRTTGVAPNEGTPLQDLMAHPGMRRWGPMIAIALLAFIFYLPGLRGMYIWDDPGWLTHNATVHSPNGLKLIWTDPSATPQYYPLVFTTFWLENKVFGDGTVGPDGILRGWGYHLDNLLLHIGSALIIFAILKKLKLPGGELGAWLAAAIFAIHPVNVESVAWVAERKNCLAGIFFFSALWFGLKFFAVTKDEAEARAKGDTRLHWGWYAATVGLFLAAMFSKTAACTLPAVLLLMVWWRRGKIRWQEVALTAPLFLIAAVMGIITARLEAASAGAVGPEFQFSVLQRVLIAGNAFWFYIGKLLWPTPLIQIYPRFPINAGQPITQSWLYIAPVMFVLLIGALFAMRKQLTRGPVTAVLFFAGVLFPVLGFINYYTMVFTFVADHYQYFACIGIIVLVVETLLWGLKRLSVLIPTEDPVRFIRLTTGLLVGGIVLSLGVQSWGASSLYTNDIELWQYNADNAPKSFYVWNNLAAAKANRGDMDGAIKAWNHSIELNPNDWRAYRDLGMLYLDAGKLDLAADNLRKSEAVMPDIVREGRLHFMEQVAKNTRDTNDIVNEMHGAGKYTSNFVIALNDEQHEKWDAAIAGFERELQTDPNNARAYFELGNCYAGKNDFARAADAYNKAIKVRPTYAQAYFNLGIVLRASGKEKEGIDALQQARRLDPAVIRHVPGLLEQGERQLENAGK